MSTDTAPAPSDTAGELLAAIAAERSAVEAWRSGDCAVAPAREYWDSVRNLVATWAQCRKIPDKLQPLVRAVNEIGTSMRNHILFVGGADFDSMIPVSSSGLGGPISCADALEEKMNASARTRPPLESVADLIAQEVPDWQIARIYELLDADGQPDAHRIYLERKNPGSQTIPIPARAEKVDRSEFDPVIERLRVTHKSLEVLYESPGEQGTIERICQIDKEFRRQCEEDYWTRSKLRERHLSGLE